LLRRIQASLRDADRLCNHVRELKPTITLMAWVRGAGRRLPTGRAHTENSLASPRSPIRLHTYEKSKNDRASTTRHITRLGREDIQVTYALSLSHHCIA
jgi:hypothetical protein